MNAKPLKHNIGETKKAPSKTSKAPMRCLMCVWVLVLITPLGAQAKSLQSPSVVLNFESLDAPASSELNLTEIPAFLSPVFVDGVEGKTSDNLGIIVEHYKRPLPSVNSDNIKNKPETNSVKTKAVKPVVKPKKPKKVNKKAVISGLFMAGGSSADTKLWKTEEFFNKSLDILPKWQRVLEKVKKEDKYYAACKESSSNCRTLSHAKWGAFMKKIHGMNLESMTSLDTLDVVNNFFNNWPYIEDIRNWQTSDYWASPEEFLDKSGDCEDYAIIKYITLKKLGVSPKNMRIVVVKDTVRNLAHAVLAVYDASGEIYILDSLMNETLPQNAMLQYTPYYSVNETGRWVHIAPIKE